MFAQQSTSSPEQIEEKMSTEEIKVWRKEWLDHLRCLSDLSVQKRWINQDITNPAWTYVEFKCRYFDDFLKDGTYEDALKEGLISQKEYACIQEFHKELDFYRAPNGSRDAAAILEDPHWLKIVRLGCLSLDFLKVVLKGTEEKKIIDLDKPYPPIQEEDLLWDGGSEDYVTIRRSRQVIGWNQKSIQPTDAFPNPIRHPDAYIRKSVWLTWDHPLGEEE